VPAVAKRHLNGLTGANAAGVAASRR
jgi:hypothetical protein